MNPFDAALQAELTTLEGQTLRRQLRPLDSGQSRQVRTGAGRLLNFSSNDYLGLAQHQALAEATREALARWGSGSGASRLMCGSLRIHHDLEDAIANLKGTDAALTFSSGYATALGTVGALVGRDDIVILDKLVHACCVDAARLSGATLRVFRHNDLDHLAHILHWCRRRPADHTSRPRRILILTESVFSMDGDVAPLKELVELKHRHGAWLMLDEAHATGLFGNDGAGLARAAGVSHQVEIQMGTLGKALGAAGGFIAGSRPLIDLLINRARSFIFSTAPAPAVSASARAAITLVSSDEGEKRRQTLWARAHALAALLPHDAEAGRVEAASPILPWIIGAEDEALRVAAHLGTRGILAPAIRFPTVARGTARLRFTVTAEHTPGDLDELRAALATVPTPGHNAA